MKVIGNRVELDGDELATAVDAYLAAHRIAVVGPRTIRIFDGNGWRLCRDTGARILCDRIVDNREPDPELADRLESAEVELCRLTHHKRGTGCSIPGCRNYQPA